MIIRDLFLELFDAIWGFLVGYVITLLTGLIAGAVGISE